MKETDQFPQQPVNGAFQCPSCGATTNIVNELNPNPFCKYCGAPLPELKSILDERYRAVQQQFNAKQNIETLKLQMKQERIIKDKENAARLKARKLEHEQRVKIAQINAETEQQKIELERTQQQYETHKKMRKSILIDLAIGWGALLLWYLIFAKK